MNDNSSFPAVLRQVAAREADQFLSEVQGINAVVIASADGFDIASAMRTGEAARIAAMASSIAAISEVVSQEANLGRGRSVTIDTEAGFACVQTVRAQGQSLVVIVVASEGAVLAQVMYRLSQVARTLADA